MEGEIIRDINGNWHQHTKDCSHCYPNNLVIATDKSNKYMETNKEDAHKEKLVEFLEEKRLNKQDWEAELRRLFTAYSGSPDKEYVEQAIKLFSTQEEKIFKQLETIDVKMGDPDAEAKIKFAIKAMIRHIKLKKEKDVSTPSINTDSATTG